MDSKLRECVGMMRKLVSDVQGAPYPSTIENELYTIWFEHIQRSAMDCFEFLNENFPLEQADVSASLDKML
ncbi:MAG: hypothetical protein IJC31_08695 [Spirochaetaceae bacterium]|nr:hypothetical protein [Spirochaetaceae bacterium]